MLRTKSIVTSEANCYEPLKRSRICRTTSDQTDYLNLLASTALTVAMHVQAWQPKQPSKPACHIPVESTWGHDTSILAVTPDGNTPGIRAQQQKCRYFSTRLKMRDGLVTVRNEDSHTRESKRSKRSAAGLWKAMVAWRCSRPCGEGVCGERR